MGEVDYLDTNLGSHSELYFIIDANYGLFWNIFIIANVSNLNINLAVIWNYFFNNGRDG